MPIKKTASKTSKTPKTSRKPKAPKLPKAGKAAKAVKKPRAKKMATEPEVQQLALVEEAAPSSKKKSTLRKVRPIPYVLKDDYVQLTLKGKPFALDGSHPTFSALVEALKNKTWSKVPGLVTLAKNMVENSQGNITVRNGAVHWKGQLIDTTLTKRIIDMVKGKKDITHMLKFMENLYNNESKDARSEFFTWLQNNDLPITDDGCFLAYKSLDDNLKDQHTHTIDNSPGQVIMMPRTSANTDYRTQCSYGFHVCSKHYGLYGKRVMAVKVNPEHVLSAVGGKIRVTKYEVLRELGVKDDLSFKAEGFSALEKQVVVNVKAERKELIDMLLNHGAVKRAIRAHDMAEASIKKATYGRLMILANRYGLVAPESTADGLAAKMPETESIYPLLAARKAAGLSVGQVAKEAGVDYKSVVKWEKDANLDHDRTDKLLKAIANLKGGRNHSVSYPVPSGNKQVAA